MATKCPACLLEEAETPRFSAAVGAMMSTALGWRLGDFCPLHRLDVQKMRGSFDAGSAKHRLLKTWKVIEGGLARQPIPKGGPRDDR